MKRFNKIYIEISNICNLKCSFCPGAKREKRRMTTQEFEKILKKIKPYTDYIYFHILGEPLFHPEIEQFLKLAENYDFKVTITTNGTLLSQKEEVLLASKSHYKTVISLHSFEANKSDSLKAYLENCVLYAKKAEGDKIIVFRLWNEGGENTLNKEILSFLKAHFPIPWKEQANGYKIGDKIFLEFGEKFEWPSVSRAKENRNIFCYALRDQIGILADGSVVPCCLDSEGEITLGNIFETELEDIINSPRALDIYNGFSNRNINENLCKKCTFVRKF